MNLLRIPACVPVRSRARPPSGPAPGIPTRLDARSPARARTPHPVDVTVTSSPARPSRPTRPQRPVTSRPPHTVPVTSRPRYIAPPCPVGVPSPRHPSRPLGIPLSPDFPYHPSARSPFLRSAPARPFARPLSIPSLGPRPSRPLDDPSRRPGNPSDRAGPPPTRSSPINTRSAWQPPLTITGPHPHPRLSAHPPSPSRSLLSPFPPPPSLPLSARPVRSRV